VKPIDVPTTRAVISEGLAALGEDADGLAELFEMMVCIGKPFDPINNPVALVLRRFGVREPMVTFSMNGYAAETHAYDEPVRMLLPHPMQVLMARFDAGNYPELISRGTA
jgi:hypothetical protein